MKKDTEEFLKDNLMLFGASFLTFLIASFIIISAIAITAFTVKACEFVASIFF